MLYVLDEPSIGLHQRDNRRLIETLLRLRDLGNTLIVVEHDEETIKAADWAVDIGPGAGEHGGHGALGHCRGVIEQSRVADRRLFVQTPFHTAAGLPSPAYSRPGGHRARRGRTQPAQCHRVIPAWPAHRRHGGVRVGQVHPGEQHPLHRPRKADLQRT